MLRAALTALTLLAATAALAVDPKLLYDLRYKAKPAGAHVAFDVTVTELVTGRSVLKSTMRTRAGQWGTLETTHRDRNISVKMRGETNGYADLILLVQRGGKTVQRSTFKFTELAPAPPARYRGQPVTLHLRDADLRDTLIALAKLTNTSIAIDPGITGTVTLDLVNVPSDQALELILKQHGLVQVMEGRVTTVRRY